MTNIVEILEVLDRNRTRATYGAVAQCLGIHSRSVSSHIGGRRPEASWIVNAKTGLPSGYAGSECHRDLLSNDRVIRTGQELEQLMASQREIARRKESIADAYRLIGLDLAWSADNNGSGIAIGRLEQNCLIVESVRSEVLGVTALAELIVGTPNIRGIAIDAPLIIANSHGSRPCERALNDDYRKFWAGAHATNTATPWKAGVELSQSLESSGFEHLAGDSKKWQIECYPHPAIVEIFGLEQRLKYKRKKGMRIEDIRQGQAKLAAMIRSLGSHSTLRLVLADELLPLMRESTINEIPASKLKANEDMLDSLVCLYIAGRYAVGVKSVVYGDREAGYIYVPTSDQ